MLLFFPGCWLPLKIYFKKTWYAKLRGFIQWTQTVHARKKFRVHARALNNRKLLKLLRIPHLKSLFRKCGNKNFVLRTQLARGLAIALFTGS
jgi:hypothetical protein